MTYFDGQHPPDPALLSDCVHCGFCLPTCPTYILWGEEMDSPRGRIQLMDLVSTQQAPLDRTVAQHVDACLGCMACVTACPSGVQYDRLLEATRPQIERNVPRAPADQAFRRLIFALFPYPARLRVAALLALPYQRLGLARLLRRSRLLARLPRLRSLDTLMPAVSLRGLLRRTPARVAAHGAARRRVALLTGCVQRVFFADVNAATVRVLAAEGCDVVLPRQGCCGALSLHAGREEEAKAFARRLVESFPTADVDAIVVNVAGCGSTLKEYGALLADDPKHAEAARQFAAKVRDITEFLAELEPHAPRSPIPARVAYHDACHLRHAQGVHTQPRALLAQIPQLEIVDIPEAEICCGSAGIYNLVHPDAAAELGQRKASNIMSVTPDAVVTANAGCLLQIRRHLDPDPVQLFHPVQLVDASIRGIRLIAADELGSNHR